MASLSRDQQIHFVAMAVAAAAAVGALVVGGEIELTLLMVAAVVSGLVCFDMSMERRLRAFVPWALLSLAPVTKTIPTVWLQLRSDDSGALPERYDHLGSLLFGLCLFAAVGVLSRPAPALGAKTAAFDAAVIIGSALVAALAGASVAFLVDSKFGSATAGRMLETPTWFVIGGLLTGVALTASRTQELSGALAGVLLVGAATAGLLAYSVAGRTFDLGYWALLFVGLTISAAATNGDLGRRSERSRQSSSGVVAAIIVGVVAAGAAISARSDRTSWEPGWALLGIASLAMFGLAMAKKPAEKRHAVRGHGRVDGGGHDLGVDDAERLARAHQRAMRSLGSPPIQPRPGPVASEVAALEPTQQPALQPDQQPVAVTAASALPPTALPPTAPPPSALPPSVQPPPALPPSAPPPTALPPSAAPLTSPAVPRVQPRPSQALDQSATSAEHGTAPKPDEPPAQSVPAQPSTVQQEVEPTQLSMGQAHGQFSGAQADPATAEQAPAQPSAAVPASKPAPTPAPLSDASLVSTVEAAAAVRTAPVQQRHTLAPLSQAHHFDPSTGLLSAAGLQHALARAFDVPRQAGHVTLMVFMIRDLDEIERNHGRLASAAVTRQVADRVSSLLPHGTGARFGRAAYAVVFVGDLSNSSETVQALARVLLQLRAPVEGGSLGDKIDVVAGMAQCYEGEDAAQFVSRANQGLARAVQSPEPTFVAMP